MAIEVTFSSEFKGLVEKKAGDLISVGQDRGVLFTEHLGELTVYIDQKPNKVIYSGTLGDHEVFVGGE